MSSLLFVFSSLLCSAACVAGESKEEDCLGQLEISCVQLSRGFGSRSPQHKQSEIEVRNGNFFLENKQPPKSPQSEEQAAFASCASPSSPKPASNVFFRRTALSVLESSKPPVPKASSPLRFGGSAIPTVCDGDEQVQIPPSQLLRLYAALRRPQGARGKRPPLGEASQFSQD